METLQNRKQPILNLEHYEHITKIRVKTQITLNKYGLFSINYYCTMRHY